jgi:putative spermidine/putrescine transport system permease protein
MLPKASANAPVYRGRKMSYPWLTGFSYLVYLFLLAPLIIVAIVSFSSSNYLQFPPPGLSLRWYANLFSSDIFLPAVGLSMRIALISTVSSITLGTMIALGLNRYHIRFRPIFQGMFMAPLIVPYIIVAVGLFSVNQFLHLRGSEFSIIFAHMAISTPYVVQMVTAGLYAVDPGLEDAAKSLGAGGLTVFRRITLPLIFPSMIGAGVFAFIVSWDEFIIAFFLSTPRLQTLPVVIFNALRERVDPTISSISTLLLVVTTVAVIASDWLRQRRVA